MMTNRQGFYSFSTFGRSRKLVKSATDILSCIHRLEEKADAPLAQESANSDQSFWGVVCEDLGIPNVRGNRTRIKIVYLQHQQVRAYVQEQANIAPPLADIDVAEPTTVVPDASHDEAKRDSASCEPPLQVESESFSVDESQEVRAYVQEQANIAPPLADIDVAEPTTVVPDASHDEAKRDSASCEPPLQVESESFSVDESQEKTSSTSSTTSTSTNGKPKYYTHNLSQQPCFFYIQHEDWRKIRRTQVGRRLKNLNWTNVIAKGIRSVHPLCSFGFKGHSVKKIGSRRPGPLFTCTGYCRFNDCNVQVHVKVRSESSLKAAVFLKGGPVRHSKSELKRRPIRADERVIIADTLSSKLPRTVHLQQLHKLEEAVLDSGCRDEVPTTGVLKTVSWCERKKKRRHHDDLISLNKMSQDEDGTEDKVIQKIIMKPKGVMLWSKKTIHLFSKRSKEDVVYLDATGSVIKKAKGESTPFYIYELVVRSPVKGCSPIPVATFVTCEHTTASVSYFLGSFITDCIKLHGPNVRRKAVMYMCDGSVVLMQSVAQNLCGLSLMELLSKYYSLVTGCGKDQTFGTLPVLHRCLSHVMKNAKDLCKKHAGEHYHLAMHVIGLMTRTTTLEELDEIVTSATVLFASPCSGDNVAKHFDNLQAHLTASAQPVIDDSGITEEDFVNDLGPTPFNQHFDTVIEEAVLDKCGDRNPYFCPNFLPKLQKYLLPQAALWSGILLGDLGRHGRGPLYEKMSKKYLRSAKSTSQNYTTDNKTQGIMEKSQWDLKRIRFQQRRLTRLDDFVDAYKSMHNALLREYKDTLRKKAKTHRVDVEKWKSKKHRRRGVYVTPIQKRFLFQKAKEKKVSRKNRKPSSSFPEVPKEDSFTSTTQQHTPPQWKPPQQSSFISNDTQKSSPEHMPSQIETGETDIKTMPSVSSVEGATALLYQTENKPHLDSSPEQRMQNDEKQLTSLWKRKDTEVVVSVLPSQIRGNNFVIHHSELSTLRPHRWLAGEVIEGLFHMFASQFNTVSTIYILNHYTAGVVLYGQQTELRRHALPKVDFNDYQAIISFVNTNRVHWKLLYIVPAIRSVYLVDPMANPAEEEDSGHAAKRVREFFKMRRICHGKEDWGMVKWRGAAMPHPFQRDGNSCGVIVTMMARAVMEAYPALPAMSFDTSKKAMARERRKFALSILNASVFDMDNNCAMCSASKPPGSGPPMTDWIQCETCERWFHEQCLGMNDDQLQEARESNWNCQVCS